MRSISGRITINLIGGILVTVVTVFLTISWMARQQNSQAEESTMTMVVGGVEAMVQGLQTIANDYAWWEEAYDAFLAQDSEWMYNNIGSSVVDTQIADMMAVITPAGVVQEGWVGEGIDVPADVILTADIVDQIRAVMASVPVSYEAAEAAYVDTGDGVMLIAFSRIAPVSYAEEVDPATLPFYVAGLSLSADRLSALGTSFLIDDLRIEFAGDAVELEAFPVVTGINGGSLGWFVWTPPQPGWDVLRNVFLPILIAVGIFALVALGTALRARKMAMDLARSERHAVAAARTDSLTNLMNRNGFNELIESVAVTGLAEQGHVAVVYLDINGFKAVNDSIGHTGGDELVTALAERLASVLPADSAFARIGGDEFAVLLTGPGAADAAAGSASALVHGLDRPFTIYGFEFHVTAAVGYAVADGGSVTPTEVLRRADLAMYQAKAGAERDAVAYHKAMETGALEKKQLESALRKAVEAHELTVAYQPIVNANDLTLVSLEVLVRWNSKEFGNISPALFIPVAEDTGLIHDIGRFVVSQACQDLANWPGVKLSVNVSPVQLRDPNFADDIRSIIARYGAEPKSFELELTEGILVSNPTIAKRKLAMLKEYGFGLSLDDFGTGFSSIGYLRQFPFDKLKLDRSFVREIGINPTANALIQSVVSLGDAMELDVVAEGIETEEQLTLLRLVQCEYIQGFYVSKPMPATEVADMLDRLGKDHEMSVRIARQEPPKVAASA